MMTSYRIGSSRRMPPIVTISAVTSPPPFSLMLLIIDSGNVDFTPDQYSDFFHFDRVLLKK